jgi:molybdenum cofactor cytidylyltransferase
MMAASKLGIAVLAAGQSKRLNQPKQLLIFEGRTLFERQMILASALQPAALWVTLGGQSDVIKNHLLDYPAVVPLTVHDFAEGMSASICSAALAAKSQNLDHLMILLVDQFRVSQAHLERLLEKSSSFPDCAIASNYAGLRMVPAIFPASWFDLLISLRGDQGARQLLRDRMDVMDCESEMDLGDVDVVGDLAQLS